MHRSTQPTKLEKIDPRLSARALFDVASYASVDHWFLSNAFFGYLHLFVDATLPGPMHRFLHHLHSLGKLLRCYTQNIDGLEYKAGFQQSGGKGVAHPYHNMSDATIVPLHGDLMMARCNKCTQIVPYTPEIVRRFVELEPAFCTHCAMASRRRQVNGLRAINGTLRANVVFYGEPNPVGEEIAKCQQADEAKSPDLLLIVGTSLKVDGTMQLIRKMSKAVHESEFGAVIMVNMEKPAPSKMTGVIDYFVQMECGHFTELLKANEPELYGLTRSVDNFPATHVAEDSDLDDEVELLFEHDSLYEAI